MLSGSMMHNSPHTMNHSCSSLAKEEAFFSKPASRQTKFWPDSIQAIEFSLPFSLLGIEQTAFAIEIADSRFCVDSCSVKQCSVRQHNELEATHHVRLCLSMMLLGEFGASIPISQARRLQVRRQGALQCCGHGVKLLRVYRNGRRRGSLEVEVDGGGAVDGR